MEGRPRLLVFCCGGPARSLMAEAFLRASAGERIICTSAALELAPVHPMAIQVMKEVGIDISALKPRSARQVLRQSFTHVVSICDLSKERCPIYPFARLAFKWAAENPASASSPEESAASFRRVEECRCLVGRIGRPAPLLQAWTNRSYQADIRRLSGGHPAQSAPAPLPKRYGLGGFGSFDIDWVKYRSPSLREWRSNRNSIASRRSARGSKVFVRT